MWAYATLGIAQPKLFQAAAQQALPRLQDFNPQESVESPYAAAAASRLLRLQYNRALRRFNKGSSRKRSSHLLRFNRANGNHLLRFNKKNSGNEDHLLRFNKRSDYDDHLLRYARSVALAPPRIPRMDDHLLRYN